MSRTASETVTRGDPSAAEGELLGERYRVCEQLGRGGAAVVHRAIDMRTGNELALKRLLPPKPGRGGSYQDLIRTHFEAEYRTLCELQHPRIVKAWDYRVEQGGPLYVMELLDGGDVGSLSPMGFRRACALARDVCSALALLHARRLVHRDVTSRNIRCTSSGQAKLIDFGAMLPMGERGPAIGTPPYCPPEVVDMKPLIAFRLPLFEPRIETRSDSARC